MQTVQQEPNTNTPGPTFLAHERASIRPHEREVLHGALDNIETTTRLLAILADRFRDEFEDEPGAALLNEFAAKFAVHEEGTL